VKTCVEGMSAGNHQYRLWVISNALARRCSFPVFADQRTSLVSFGMSQKCQEATLANSIDHIVGDGEHARRDCEAECLRRLEVDD
jgi:hypothetical protein